MTQINLEPKQQILTDFDEYFEHLKVLEVTYKKSNAQKKAMIRQNPIRKVIGPIEKKHTNEKRKSPYQGS